MYTIVVADDEEELRRAIIRKNDWESTGFRVVGEAENGIEALELVERMEPDLLLTDIRMPFVSGIELARQVREVRPTTQIAFLSGFDEFSYAHFYFHTIYNLSMTCKLSGTLVPCRRHKFACEKFIFHTVREAPAIPLSYPCFASASLR